MLISNFHRGLEPRENQRYILNEMDTLLKSGYTRFIISAPTGSGKSHIANALANALGDAFIVTSTKQLQDQYSRDFPEMLSIKGKSNFECRQLMKKENIGEKHNAMLKGLTCEKGQCITKLGGKVVDTCQFMEPNPDGQCVYYKQKYDGLAHAHTVLNYSMYFHLKKFQKDVRGVNRRTAIFDEAHTIESETVRFVGYEIPGAYMTETNLDQKQFDVESIHGMLDMLDALKSAYTQLISKNSQPNTEHEIMRVRRWDKRLENIINARRDINNNSSNFIMQDPEFDRQGRLSRISAVPLDISRYTNDMFDADILVFMSATISGNNFSKSIGIKNCAFIDVPKSPFSAENRKVEFKNVARLSSRSPESDEIRVAAAIDGILTAHENSRGLILTSSKARCYNLLKKLSRRQARRIEIAHSKNENNASMEDVLAAHQDTPNGVLLSSSLWQGVDLKGDLSRFQIIEKCPYPYLGDNRVAAKNKTDRGWYVYQTVVKILQGLGRSVRDIDDYATTYVMDTAVQDLLRQHRMMVPAAYHDAIFSH